MERRNALEAVKRMDIKKPEEREREELGLHNSIERTKPRIKDD